MSDDLREREPLRDHGDFPPEEGIRSDHAGTGAGTVGPAPAGGDPERMADGPAGGDEPPARSGATAGGDGSRSERPSSGGTGEGTTTSDDHPQTEWLRRADGGGAGDSEQR